MYFACKMRTNGLRSTYDKSDFDRKVQLFAELVILCHMHVCVAVQLCQLAYIRINVKVISHTEVVEKDFLRFWETCVHTIHKSP